MQRIYPWALTAEKYVAEEGHRQVRGEGVCPRCGKAGRLHRHGSYRRSVTGALGKILEILVARFLCVACKGTVSYLPEFALSYRLVGAETMEAFLEGRLAGLDVQRWEGLLRQYRRRMEGYAESMYRVVGCGFGRGPPAQPEQAWPWLRAACGGMAAATRRLVTVFGITPFERYQCHQPGRR